MEESVEEGPVGGQDGAGSCENGEGAERALDVADLEGCCGVGGVESGKLEGTELRYVGFWGCAPGEDFVEACREYYVAFEYDVVCYFADLRCEIRARSTLVGVVNMACARDDRWVDKPCVLHQVRPAIGEGPVDDACTSDIYRGSVPA